LIEVLLSSDDDDDDDDDVQVMMSVMFFHGTVKDDFDARWKSRHLVKQFMEHKVS